MNKQVIPVVLNDKAIRLDILQTLIDGLKNGLAACNTQEDGTMNEGSVIVTQHINRALDLIAIEALKYSQKFEVIK